MSLNFYLFHWEKTEVTIFTNSMWVKNCSLVFYANLYFHRSITWSLVWLFDSMGLQEFSSLVFFSYAISLSPHICVREFRPVALQMITYIFVIWADLFFLHFQSRGQNSDLYSFIVSLYDVAFSMHSSTPITNLCVIILKNCNEPLLLFFN